MGSKEEARGRKKIGDGERGQEWQERDFGGGRGGIKGSKQASDTGRRKQ